MPYARIAGRVRKSLVSGQMAWTIIRPTTCLEAVARANPAVDDPLVEVVAGVVIVGRLSVEEHVAGDVKSHAELGADDPAVLDALAADIADLRADEGVPGAQVPLMADTQRRPGRPTRRRCSCRWC